MSSPAVYSPITVENWINVQEIQKKEKAKSDRILTACMRRFQSVMKEKLKNNFDNY